MSTLTPPPEHDWLGHPAPPQYQWPPPPPNSLGITAMVVGIVGLVLTPALAWYLIGAPIGLIMGPIAMVTGWIGRRRAQQGLAADSGFALVGAILGLVTVLVALAVGGFGLWLISGDWD